MQPNQSNIITIDMRNVAQHIIQFGGEKYLFDQGEEKNSRYNANLIH